MQTFAPYPSFKDSAAVLDRQRLGKQRVEALQIMKTLALNTGWINHPAVHMWRGHELSLLRYQEAIINEWKSRGYKDTCLGKTYDIFDAYFLGGTFTDPPWLGSYAFHLSHRSNLLRKNREFYLPIFGAVPDGLEYVWPGVRP